MSDENTPTTDEVRETYERARYYLDDTPEEGDSYRAGGGEFDRWITAHDSALREQIARAVEAHIDDDGTDEWFAAIEHAASIARGEGSE